MKLLVLDGNSIVNRAFYGIKLLSTKDGHYTNAIYGFMNILNSLIDREKPDGVAVAFDLHAPTFRHKMYDEYKAGRKPMPEELREQIPVLKELLPLFGYKCVEKEGYEADDILGTLSLAAEKSGNSCVISTGDRDSLQLVSDKTRVLLAATKMGRPEIIEYDRNMLMEKYGLTPDEMIELKALMGDASDHIPGVAGIGQKTATDLVQRFHSVDYIYENIDTIDIKDSVRNKLIMGKESAILSKTLGTICRTSPVSTDMNDYIISKRDDKRLAVMLKKLEFYKMLDKLGLSYLSELADDEPQKPATVFEILDTDMVIRTAKENNSVVVVLDEDEKKAGICCNKKIAVIEDNEKLCQLLNSGIEISTENSKALFNRFGDKISGALIDFDIILAGYLCSPSSSSYDIDRLAEEYLNSKPQTNSEDKLINKTAAAALLTQKLKLKTEEAGLSGLLNEIEIPLAKTLSEMERIGFLIDCDGIKKMSESMKQRIKELEQQIFELAGKTFNVKSPAQLGTVLFEDLGLPSKKKTKSGYSTTAEILEKLKNQHPIISLILEYRRLTKLDSTYCEGLLKAVQPDGRIHTTFNQTETRTGRISSLEPNLQNIPVRTNEGRELRKFFSAKDGYVLIDADYSQIELRVLADIADDKNMQDAFTGGVDIHTKTASEVFDMPPVLVTPQMRRSAKAVNFGIVYGMGAFTLASDIGVSRTEAAQYIEGYFRTYPNVKKYMDNIVQKAKRDGYVTTFFGRRRYLPELKASNKNLIAFGERVAKNMPIQGTAADIIKLAMIRVRNSLKNEKLDAKLILQVHDELIIEASQNDAKRAGEILKSEMENAAKLKVPLTVDMHSGKTWFEAKD